jgi:hypothetical protein
MLRFSPFGHVVTTDSRLTSCHLVSQVSHVGFVVDKVTLRQGFVPSIPFFPFNHHSTSFPYSFMVPTLYNIGNWQRREVREFVGAFAKLRKVTISFVMYVRLSSVRPHGTARLPHDGFSWNLILTYFSKICQENLSLIKIWRITGTLHEDHCVFF